MNSITKNAFPEARKEGDLDLVAEITSLLTKKGHPNPAAWTGASDIQEAQGKHPKLQRFLINRYWRMQLGNLGVTKGIDTRGPRFALMDEPERCDDREYLAAFSQYVTPTILEHGL